MTRKEWMQKGYLRDAVRNFKFGLRKTCKKVSSGKLYSLLLGILYLVVIITLAISIGMNFAPFFDTAFLIDSYSNVKNWFPKTPFQQLPAMAISSAALIALLAYSRGKRQSKSEFFFKQASDGLDEAYKLLSDQNNDRVIWVRASRTLLQARKIAKDIPLEEYQRAYRLYEEKIRHKLYLVLTTIDSKTGNRNSLPAQFFFGLQDWEKDAEAKTPLNEVAIKASRPIEAYRINIDEVPPDPPYFPLSEKSVVAIFDFLEYPEDYENPLDEVEMWKKSWSDVIGMSGGAARYVAHRKAKLAINGKLHDRPPPDDE